MISDERKSEIGGFVKYLITKSSGDTEVEMSEKDIDNLSLLMTATFLEQCEDCRFAAEGYINDDHCVLNALSFFMGGVYAAVTYDFEKAAGF